MARYCGKIGFIKTVQTSRGVWENSGVIEQVYYGDIIRRNIRLSGSENGTNDNIFIDNCVSIIGDSFAIENLNFMKYAEYMGVKWKIKNIEVQRPRIILTLGDEYNG